MVVLFETLTPFSFVQNKSDGDMPRPRKTALGLVASASTT